MWIPSGARAGRRRDYSTVLAPGFLVAARTYGVLAESMRMLGPDDPPRVIPHTPVRVAAPATGRPSRGRAVVAVAGALIAVIAVLVLLLPRGDDDPACTVPAGCPPTIGSPSPPRAPR